MILGETLTKPRRETERGEPQEQLCLKIRNTENVGLVCVGEDNRKTDRQIDKCRSYRKHTKMGKASCIHIGGKQKKEN